MSAPIRIKGFTNEVLKWKPWLDTVNVDTVQRPSSSRRWTR